MRIILLFAALLPIFASAEGQIIVGVIEQEEGNAPDSLCARALFFKKGSEWVRFYDMVANTTRADVRNFDWTMAFDGRNLGNVRLQDPDPDAHFKNIYYFQRYKQYLIKPGGVVPILKSGADKFGGSSGEVQRRPIVIVSQPFYSDPDHWKPFTPDSSYRQRFFGPMRVVIGRFGSFHCPGGPEGNKTEYFDFKPGDLVFGRCYQSSKRHETYVGRPRHK